jgi:hypothetical protein
MSENEILCDKLSYASKYKVYVQSAKLPSVLEPVDGFAT